MATAYLPTLLVVFLIPGYFAAKLTMSGAFETKETEAAFIESKLANATVNSIPKNLKNETVYIFLDLYQIIDVEEKQGLLHLKVYYYIYYELPSLVWDPEQEPLYYFTG